MEKMTYEEAAQLATQLDWFGELLLLDEETEEKKRTQ